VAGREVLGLWHYRNVGFWSKAFRLTAMFLVLFAAVEILACDLLPSSDCYISSRAQDHDKGLGQGQNSCDNCLCCCAHVVVVKPIILIPQEKIVAAAPEMGVERPLFSPASIDHPPQLS
jgi:hypothetical protein